MSTSSNSSCNTNRIPKIFKVDMDGNLYCHHEIRAVIRVAGRRSVRCGAEFYGCSQWPRDDCKFFMWKKDFDKLFEVHSTCSSSAVTRSDAMTGNEYNLQLRNNLLSQENNMLKRQICAKEFMLKQQFVFSLFVIIAMLFYIVYRI
ncbi:putative transcription factor GRF family [Helianthus annuus]|nr:putative transcription factor GRF family [Helianthus annuus]